MPHSLPLKAVEGRSRGVWILEMGLRGMWILEVLIAAVLILLMLLVLYDVDKCVLISVFDMYVDKLRMLIYSGGCSPTRCMLLLVSGGLGGILGYAQSTCR